MEFEADLLGQKMTVKTVNDRVSVDGKELEFSMEKIGNVHYIYIGSRIHRVTVLGKDGNVLRLSVNGKKVTVGVKDQIALTLERLGIDTTATEIHPDVRAPMPGVILDILVQEGQSISKGDPLLILEAMKMENAIKAPQDCVINQIPVNKGESVEKNAVLIKLD